MKVGQPYLLQIFDGEPAGSGSPHGFSGISRLSISSKRLTEGGPPALVNFTPGASQTGTFSFKCIADSCGSGHGNMDGSITIVP